MYNCSHAILSTLDYLAPPCRDTSLCWEIASRHTCLIDALSCSHVLSRFFLAIQYSEHNNLHFVINLTGLLLCVIPKIPGVEGTRLFGLNRF